jgi:hypothetical protein
MVEYGRSLSSVLSVDISGVLGRGHCSWSLCGSWVATREQNINIVIVVAVLPGYELDRFSLG